MVANSHRGLSEIYKGTLWEPGNWGDSLKRLPSATSTKQRRFSGDVRSLGTFIPQDLIPDWEPPPLRYLTVTVSRHVTPPVRPGTAAHRCARKQTWGVVGTSAWRPSALRACSLPVT